MNDTRNARIKATDIYYRSEILTATIDLDYGGSGQGFGGYDLRDKLADFVNHLLTTLEVDHWNHLKGLPVRVKRENGLVTEIGHFTEDKWFRPKDLWKEEK